MISYYQYQYRGLSYKPKVTEKNSVRKVEHFIFDEKGKLVKKADFTPYCFMSKVDFKNYVELGLPKRDDSMINAFSSDSLRKKINKGNK
ncbi:MAG: hypothetical protein EBU90_20335 [Proteobacteria bacterium]|nr:hypothetical protein [Pseudomonadota bacterium]